MTTIVHLTSSTFFGGPERQMLGLADAFSREMRTVFLSFSEGGRCHAFLDRAAESGFTAVPVPSDTPRFRAAIRDLCRGLVKEAAAVLFVHGYKAGLLGRIAARRVGIPVVAVSRGWTGENPKVRFYEFLDKINLRSMDRVVCVARGQAQKVRRAGVRPEKLVVIPNAVDLSRFAERDPRARRELEGLFSVPVRQIVGAAGRLSPEKGFSDLVEAAAHMTGTDPSIGFVLFGEGALRPALEAQIAERGLTGRFILAGFRSDLDRLVPALDLLAQSSYTEGMPNVVLEACAAGVPVVATAVGGTPEILSGRLEAQLVPPANPPALSERIRATLAVEAERDALGALEREHVRASFTFAAQARMYSTLIEGLTCPHHARTTTRALSC